ncbi:MAG: acetyl-CoA carboxylase biotin carboxyl carrier protein [Candidatus Eisenbacteria bacterium]
MKISFLKKLIQIVESSEIEELEVRRWWTKVRITKSRPRTGTTNTGSPVETRVDGKLLDGEVQTESAPRDEKLAEIKSPMVGTFYRSASPGVEPYVEVGQEVQTGQVVCIIEAMKLMNEIESDVSGNIARILVENGQPVEFGQTLFLVSPS